MKFDYLRFCSANALASAEVYKAEKSIGATDCDCGSDVSLCAGNGEHCMEYGFCAAQCLVPAGYRQP